MSIQSNQYIMYGIELDYTKNYKELDSDKKLHLLDNFCDNAFETDDIDKPLMAIIDGMNGEYMKVGKILFKSDNRSLLKDCINLSEIKLPKKSKLQELIKKEFNVDIKKSDFKLMLFEHIR